MSALSVRLSAPKATVATELVEVLDDKVPTVSLAPKSRVVPADIITQVLSLRADPPSTRRVPTLMNVRPVKVLAPVRVMVPAPFLVKRPPTPVIEPLKVVLAPLSPTVKTLPVVPPYPTGLLPRKTLPAPETEPTVSLHTPLLGLRLYAAPAAMVTSEVLGVSPAVSGEVSSAAASTPALMIVGPVYVLAPVMKSVPEPFLISPAPPPRLGRMRTLLAPVSIVAVPLSVIT